MDSGYLQYHTKQYIEDDVYLSSIWGIYYKKCSNELSKRSMKPFKVNDIIKVVHHEKDYDFVDDGNSCHHNQFCK